MERDVAEKWKLSETCVRLPQMRLLCGVGCIRVIDLRGGGGGGGGWEGFRPITLETKYFELGVGGEGRDTSRHLEVSFGSIRAILPM